MRIISAPVSGAPVQPVRAADTAENRTQRDQAAREAATPKGTAAGQSFAAANSVRQQWWAGQGTVDASVTAQKVFHAVYGDRPESSLTEANRAYTKSDELRFRDTPFSLRLI